mgnify:FL=1
MARTPQFDRDTALTNAMSLFWRQGYHATSMKDIEHALDMRPGSIYAAFGSKERLFREALASYGEATKEDFATTLATGSCELEGVTNLTLSMVEQTQSGIPSKACMLIKTLLELSNSKHMDNQPVKDYMSDLQRLFADKFRRVIAAGELSPHAQPERLARLYQSSILGLSVMAQRDLPVEELQQLAEDINAQLLPSHQS